MNQKNVQFYSSKKPSEAKQISLSWRCLNLFFLAFNFSLNVVKFLLLFSETLTLCVCVCVCFENLV